MLKRCKNGWTECTEALKDHPFTLLGVVIGVIAFLAVIAVTKDTVTRISNVERRIEVVRSESPCAGMDARTCARLLLDALPPAERRAFVRRVEVEELRLARAEARRRAAIRERGENPGSVRQPGKKRPRRPGRPGGGNPPAGPPTPTPPPPSPPPNPCTSPGQCRPPLIDPGPIGPIDLPPIYDPLPCIPIVRPC